MSPIDCGLWFECRYTYKDWQRPAPLDSHYFGLIRTRLNEFMCSCTFIDGVRIPQPNANPPAPCSTQEKWCSAESARPMNRHMPRLRDSALPALCSGSGDTPIRQGEGEAASEVAGAKPRRSVRLNLWHASGRIASGRAAGAGVTPPASRPFSEPHTHRAAIKVSGPSRILIATGAMEKAEQPLLKSQQRARDEGFRPLRSPRRLPAGPRAPAATDHLQVRPRTCRCHVPPFFERS